jgi:hypothetical protein
MDIIAMVERTYNSYPWKKINRLWITLQLIYDQVIIHHGCNHFKIPHMNKEKLERQDQLPVALKVSSEVRREARFFDDDDDVDSEEESDSEEEDSDHDSIVEVPPELNGTSDDSSESESDNDSIELPAFHLISSTMTVPMMNWMQCQ